MFVRWVRYLKAIGYGPGEAVWINMDETQLPHHVGGKMGNIKKTSNKDTKAKMKEKATLAQKRKHTTYMACITNKPELQTAVPQILLPNPKGDKKRWKSSELTSNDDKNIVLNLESSGWVNCKIMVWWLKTLHDAMAKKKISKVVLVMDCCTSHYALRVVRMICKYKWKLILVPAKLTFMIQPLDLFCFQAFKKN